MPRALLLIACLARSSAFVSPTRQLAAVHAATVVEGDQAAEVEPSLPKTPPPTPKLVLPGDRGSELNYGFTVVAAGVTSLLLLTAALPADWQQPPSNSRDSRAAKVETMLREGKKLEKVKGRVVAVAELSATEKAEAVALGAAPFVIAPVLLLAPYAKRIYDVARTEEILKDSRDGGRKYAAPASRSIGQGMRKLLGKDL